MPPDNRTVESRLAEVEDELRRLKNALTEKGSENGMPWWKQIIGSRENDPIFAEIVELGRKIRKQGRSPSSKSKRRVAKPSPQRKKT